MNGRRTVLAGFWISALAAVIAAVSLNTGAQSADVKADYDRSNSLNQRTANKVYDLPEAPVWIAGSPQFWYRKAVKGGNEFVLVDPVAATKAPAFDHAKLATAMVAAGVANATALNLQFTTFNYADNRQAIEFAIGPGGGGGGRGGGGGAGRGGQAPVAGAPAANRYRCTLSDYVCTRQTTAPEPAAGGAAAAGQGRGGRQGGGGANAQGGGAPEAPPVRPSPDRKLEALIQNYNIFIRPLGGRGTFIRRFRGQRIHVRLDSVVARQPEDRRVPRAPWLHASGHLRSVIAGRSAAADDLHP